MFEKFIQQIKEKKIVFYSLLSLGILITFSLSAVVFVYLKKIILSKQPKKLPSPEAVFKKIPAAKEAKFKKDAEIISQKDKDQIVSEQIKKDMVEAGEKINKAPIPSEKELEEAAKQVRELLK